MYLLPEFINFFVVATPDEGGRYVYSMANQNAAEEVYRNCLDNAGEIANIPFSLHMIKTIGFPQSGITHSVMLKQDWVNGYFSTHRPEDTFTDFPPHTLN